LEAAGFNQPRLFVDGAYGEHFPGTRLRERAYCASYRYPAIGVYGNWILTLWELYLREPLADRYLIFQDDLVVCRGLKEYLEKCPLPTPPEGKGGGYFNLYAHRPNETIAEDKAAPKKGWFLSNQRGQGALALMFTREGVTTLLQARHMVMKPQGAAFPTKKVDGAVIEAMVASKWVEFCHYPSLCQHIGLNTSASNPLWPLSQSWQGEEWDARSMLNQPGAGVG
jgi:hypothetical protein